MEFVEHRFRNETFQVPKRYTDLKKVGSGNFGRVCSAYDEKLKTEVAIKKIIRPFETILHAKRVYREIKILNHIDHDNVICLIDRFTPSTDFENFENFANVYVVTPLMSTDLDKLLKSDIKLPDDQVQFFVYQILRGLKYIHSTEIIHRDLKPANIAINEDNELKILDFGLARQSQDDMTGYVVTRWYRAPEITLFPQIPYTNKIDIWSVGCIMWEMFNKHPLFPGEAGNGQLQTIFQKTGIPDDDLMNKIDSEFTKEVIRDLVPDSTELDFQSVLSTNIQQESAIDLLSKMLKLDPIKRISAEDALSHPYMTDYHDESDEPTGETYEDESEDSLAKLTIDQWKEKIFDLLHQEFLPNINSLTKQQDT